MGKETGYEESLVSHSHPRLSNLKKVVSKLNHLSPIEKLEFLKNIDNKHLKIILEIFYNFIRGNLLVNQRSYKNLKKHKKLIYKFISRKTSSISKKKILKTLQGLNILCILIPLAAKTLNI